MTPKIVRAVVGIIRRDDKILIAQRPDGKPYAGYWEFPGGKIETDETAEHALKRELREELGIDVIEIQHWFSHQHCYPDKIVELEIFFVDQFVSEPQSLENQILQFCTLNDMAALQLLEGNWLILDKLKLMN